MMDQTFSNLDSRTLPEKFFHSVHINLRDMSGAKLPFLFVGTAQLVLKHRKPSNIFRNENHVTRELL